jgi:hypothetical protein
LIGETGRIRIPGWFFNRCGRPDHLIRNVMKPAISLSLRGYLDDFHHRGDLKEPRSLDAIGAMPRREAIKRRLPENVSQEE